MNALMNARIASAHADARAIDDERVRGEIARGFPQGDQGEDGAGEAEHGRGLPRRVETRRRGASEMNE
tara:strand:- start:524 stop:727 length:204 start_codon:yes stop_codon:yes gene_type:complete